MSERPWVSAYDDRVPHEIVPDGLTLPEILSRTAKRFPKTRAIRFVNRAMTYRELDAEVSRFASALSALGLGRGDRVAIHLPNLPQTVIAFYGTLAAGGVAVLTNPLYVAREIESQWKDAGCTIAVTADFLYRGPLEEIRTRLPVKHWIVASIPEYLKFPLNLLAPFKLRKQSPPAIAAFEISRTVHRFRALTRRSTGGAAVRVTPDDLAALQYTGGTTGIAKGAMLTHGNLAANAQQTASWLPVAQEGREVFLAALPYFHVFGLTVGMNFPIRIGGEMIVMPNPRDVRGLVQAIERERVTIFPVVPSMVRAISNLPGIEKADLSSLKVCVSGSAPLPEGTLRRFESLTSAKIIEGYGLTEASPVTHCNPVFGARHVSAIGFPFPSTDCRILGEDGVSNAPIGEPGELLIRGPQVMKGYWNQPGETAASLKDGWLHTGDLATMDEHGVFRIVGRKKEMIVAGGYKIYPDEVDRVLAAHPAVAESATIGVPDERRGETVKSFVVLHPGMSAEPSELAAHCHTLLAPYKVPKQIELRSELPKSSILKVLRRQLLQEELAKRGD
jgi:long-chain acyl-CoA synthetase